MASLLSLVMRAMLIAWLPFAFLVDIASAQYPTRPVIMTVGFSAGGAGGYRHTHRNDTAQRTSETDRGRRE